MHGGRCSHLRYRGRLTQRLRPTPRPDLVQGAVGTEKPGPVRSCHRSYLPLRLLLLVLVASPLARGAESPEHGLRPSAHREAGVPGQLGEGVFIPRVVGCRGSGVTVITPCEQRGTGHAAVAMARGLRSLAEGRSPTRRRRRAARLCRFPGVLSRRRGRDPASKPQMSDSSSTSEAATVGSSALSAIVA